MNEVGLIDPLRAIRTRRDPARMAGYVPSKPTQDRAALRTQVQRAARSAAPREELEYLLADVAAEILLLEVDLRRAERALLTALGPRVQPRDIQAQVEAQGQLEHELVGLRTLAAEIRAQLTAAA